MCNNCVKDGTMTEQEWEKMREGIPDAIRKLFEDDPNSATNVMDANVLSALKQLRERLANVQNLPEMGTPEAQKVFADLFAANLMYQSEPSAIALTLALMTYRYNTLLSEWSAMFVARNGDEDGIAGLATEARTAVKELRQEINEGHVPGTGMYL